MDDVITVISDKLDQLAKEGQLAKFGYQPLDVITRDTHGKLHVHTFPGVDADEVVAYLKQYLHGEGAGSLESYLVIDCVAGERQGTTLSDILVIIHCQADRGFRVGLIEYEAASNPLHKKLINWNNTYWRRTMAALGTEVYNALRGQRSLNTGSRKRKKPLSRTC